MAENKKGFVLYADQKELFDQLPNEKAGELIKHIFAYVNDDDPETEDILIRLAFTPIKQQLKRDLEKWESKQDKNSEAGKKSAGKKAWNKWLLENPSSNLTLEEHLSERVNCIKMSDENIGDYMFYYWQEAIKFHELNITRLENESTKSTLVESVEKDSTKSTVNVKANVTAKAKAIKEEIPPLTEFLEYAKEKKPNVDSESVKLKYESWRVLGWKSGKGVQIKNWKSTLLNTLPHLKEAKPKAKSNGAPLF